jgi:hypothetical protein
MDDFRELEGLFNRLFGRTHVLRKRSEVSRSGPPSRAGLFLAFGTLLLSQAPAALSQSYGGGDQVLTIGAAAFRAKHASIGDIADADDYLYPTGAGFNLFVAPVRLPDGAVISQMCAYWNVTDASFYNYAQLTTANLAPAGESPGVRAISGSFASPYWDFGYGVVCSGNIGFVVHDTADVNMDGITEHIALSVFAVLEGNSGLGGVRIIWHRQVSPPPATASFDDVPVGSPFFQFIEALKAAGITSGCQASPPQFCPDRPLTRAEMAVYLSLALGLHWPE